MEFVIFVKFKKKTWLTLFCIGIVLCSSAQSLNTLPRFKNIPSDVFKNIDVTSFCYTQTNTLYIGTTNGLFVLQQSKIIDIPLPVGSNNIITSLISKGDSIWIGTNAGILVLNTTNKKVEKIIIKGRLHTTIDSYSLVLQIDPKQNLYFYTGYDTSAYYTYNIATKKTTFLFNKSDAYRAYVTDAAGNLSKLWVVEATGLAYYYFGAANKVVKKNSFFYGGATGPATAISAIVTDKNGLWCATNKGLLQFDIQQHHFTFINHPLLLSFNDVVQLKNKLICSNTNGIYIYDTTQKKWQAPIAHIPDDPYSIPHNSIKKIALLNNDVLVVATKKGISFWMMEPSKQLVQHVNNNITGSSVFFAHNGKQGLIANNEGVHFLDEFLKATSEIPVDNFDKIKKAVQLSTDKWLAISSTKCFLINKGIIKEIVGYPLKTTNHFEFVAKGPFNEYIIGGAQGLFKIDTNFSKYSKIPLDSTVLFYYYQHGFAARNLFFANANYSYVDVLKSSNQPLFTLVERVHTGANIYHTVPLDSNNYLLACNTGLQLLNTKNYSLVKIDNNFTKPIYKILLHQLDTILFAIDGLYTLNHQVIKPYLHYYSNVFSASENTNICLLNSTVYFTEDDKLYGIDLKADSMHIMRCNKISVLINKQAQQSVALLYGKPLTVDVDINEFLPFINYHILYSITNGNEWIEIEDNSFSLERLPVGNLQLIVKVLAGNKLIFTSANPIVVKPKWYQTKYFSFFAAFAIMAIVVLVVLFIFSRQRNKNRRKMQLQEQLRLFESKALRSQMNPHFIFNTMNSINSAVIENNTSKASECINQFSKLMRQTLDNSQHESISLDKELASVQLYLQLEQFRVDYQFTFAIKVDPNVVVNNCIIPPLLLQPYVENSIWHGLIHKQPSGKIFIEVTATDYFFTIEITDNGIGRKAAAAHSISNKSSMATGITEQRVKVLNSNNTVQIIDLLDTNGNPKGTKVMLTFYQNFID